MSNSKIITPTVGRKVHYRKSRDSEDSAMAALEGQPLDATIVAVWNDRLVNVAVLDANAKLFPRTCCTLIQDGDPKPDGRYVEWMPFQLGQARQLQPEVDKLKEAYLKAEAAKPESAEASK